MEQTKFYLNSTEYPADQYPLIHSINSESLEYQREKEYGFYKEIFYCSFTFLAISLICCASAHSTHIYMYNAIYGPYHLNTKEFIRHVLNFGQQKEYFPKDYVQVELGPDNIQTPENPNNIIRQYELLKYGSEDYTHVATYKYLTIPDIFVKLPSRHVSQIHTKFPFDFSKFSVSTLKCIWNTLPGLKNINIKKTRMEKSDMIKSINTEYAKNSTAFNMQILTKCGILI